MEILEKINPHWFEEEDEDIAKWKNKRIRIVPEWINKLSLRPFSLNFVLGPRRVGKTTGIKLLIQKLIKKGVKPIDIVYVDCDLISELSFFQQILSYLSENKFKFIFVDEATSLKEWWRPLKGFIDAGMFKNSVIVVTGSITLKVKKHAEMFPGRKGEGKIIEVLPLSFPEYVRLFNLFNVKKTEIKKLFQRYLKSGGFLGALENETAFMKELLEAIKSEILKVGLSEKLVFQIISSLLKKIPSALSYQSIASDIGIDYKTVAHYLETLEEMYLIGIAYWKEKQIKWRKEKKIFLRDPLLFHTFKFWTSTKPLESALYEHIVQEHLLRKFGEIYYYRNKYEIDCIAKNLKVEVKAGKPYRKYPRSVKVVDETNIAEFLLELEK